MATLGPDARALVESPRLAHMVTLNPDGSPQVSCVWVGLDGEEILTGHLPRNQKVKNVERDPRDDPPPGYVIRTTPERIGGVGPWVDD